MTLPSLAAALRSDAAFARAVTAALRRWAGNVSALSVPGIAVATWRREHTGEGFVCESVGGARIGYVAPAKKAPLRWSAWADVPAGYEDGSRVRAWPRPAQDADHGIALVTEALGEAGWTVHPEEGG